MVPAIEAVKAGSQHCGELIPKVDTRTRTHRSSYMVVFPPAPHRSTPA